MADNLQQKMFSGMVWTLIRQTSLQVFAFIEGIILARTLDPSDYGIIAMPSFFMALSGCFIDSGFAMALVRKKNRTAIDYSTVFVTTVCLTFFFSTLLCICSPLIAKLFKQPILIKIVCANAVLLFLNSFLAIQNTRLTIEMDFKAQNIFRVITNVTIGVVSITMALTGFGIWSLVWPNFIMPFLNGYLYWHHKPWFPGFKFSWKSWKEFFSYGSNILISNLIATVSDNLYPLVIGAKFSAKSLGYYTRAQGYSNLPVYTLQTVLGPVAFPVLCSINDDNARLREVFRRLIRVTAYLVFPMLIGLAILSRPAIYTLITGKWEQSVVYLRILCFACLFGPINMLNLDLLQVKGRSDLSLRLEIIKRVASIGILVISIPFGLLYMCWGQVVSSLLCYGVNTYYTGKLINIGFLQQLHDFIPTIFYTLIMGAVMLISCSLVESNVLKLIVGILSGTATYLTLSILTKSLELAYIKILIKENVIKHIKTHIG